MRLPIVGPDWLDFCIWFGFWIGMFIYIGLQDVTFLLWNHHNLNMFIKVYFDDKLLDKFRISVSTDKTKITVQEEFCFMG